MHPAASKLDLGWSDQGESQHGYLKYVFFLRLMRSVYIEPFLDAINDKVFSPRKQQSLFPANSTFVIVDSSCGIGKVSLGSSLLGQWAFWRWGEIRKIRNPGRFLTLSLQPSCKPVGDPRGHGTGHSSPSHQRWAPRKRSSHVSSYEGDSEHPLRPDEGVHAGLPRACSMSTQQTFPKHQLWAGHCPGSGLGGTEP